jgi:hypothetical protein
MVAHACNPSNLEAEIGLSVQGQPGLYRPCLKKQNKILNYLWHSYMLTIIQKNSQTFSQSFLKQLYCFLIYIP